MNGSNDPRARTSRRRGAQLARRYRTIVAYAGLIWIFAAAVLVSPLLALPAYPGEVRRWWAYVLPALALAGVGALAWRLRLPAHERDERAISLSEGAAVVVLAWLGAIAAGSLTLALTAGLGFTQAVFEATSAWTTTGLSVVDVTTAPRLVLLLRSNLELAGGAGLAILMISVMGGPAGQGLSSAEGRQEQLVPHVVRSAKLVIVLYSVYNALGVLALRLAGMSWFDAVNHAFAAVSTGGFSTRVESIGYWDSPAVEGVTIVLMLLGTTSFIVAWRLAQGHWRDAVRNGELRLLLVLVAVGSALLTWLVTAPRHGGLPGGLRVAVFNVVSALSTSGFSTVDYAPWGPFGVGLLILLQLIGGGTGSTAGGIKLARVHLLVRVVVWEVQRTFLPRAAITRPYVWQGGERAPVLDEDARRVAAFVVVYLCAFVAGSGVIAAHGVRLQDAMFEMASSLSTVGLSVGVTRPDAPPAILWTQILGMLLGRLEFFALIVGVLRLLRDGAGWAGSLRSGAEAGGRAPRAPAPAVHGDAVGRDSARLESATPSLDRREGSSGPARTSLPPVTARSSRLTSTNGDRPPPGP